jgi:hypothetical protein
MALLYHPAVPDPSSTSDAYIGVRRALDTNDDAELPIVAPSGLLKVASEHVNQCISMPCT